MRWFSHTRFWFSDSQRYTPAQIQELHALQRLSNTHLASSFDQSFFNMFAARTEGGRYYVDLTDFNKRIYWLDIPTGGDLPPIHSCYFLYFADAISDAFKRYDKHRQNRWYGSGHPNDPTRLFILQLHRIANWLVSASPDDAQTLARANALLAYLAALQNQRVFTQEPDNYGSMNVFLENLQSLFRQIQERAQYRVENPVALSVQSVVSPERKLQDEKFRLMPFKQKNKPINDLYGVFLAFDPYESYGRQCQKYALCLETPQAVPTLSFFSRGMHHRSVYLQNSERLFKIAEDFLWFKGKDGVSDYDRLRSPEGQALLASLRSRLRAESAETKRLSADLWWPFHGSSLSFFSYWKENFQLGLEVLQDIERNSQLPDSKVDPVPTVPSYDFALGQLRSSPISTEILADADARLADADAELLRARQRLAETTAAFTRRQQSLREQREQQQEMRRAVPRESKLQELKVCASLLEDNEGQYDFHSPFEMKH